MLKKLAFKGGDFLVYQMPQETELTELFDSVRPVAFESGTFSWLIAFVVNAEEVRQFAAAVASNTAPDPVLWMAYPKAKSARRSRDLSRDTGWEPLGAFGYEPVSAVSINDDWTALRFRKVDQIKTMKRKGGGLTEEGKKRIKSNL